MKRFRASSPKIRNKRQTHLFEVGKTGTSFKHRESMMTHMTMMMICLFCHDSAFSLQCLSKSHQECHQR